MSRTFAHRPFWVHLGDPTLCVPVCDHTNGPCDLVGISFYFYAVRHGEATYGPLRRCRWEVDINRIPPPCGCPMCTGHFDRRFDRRRDRHQSRTALHVRSDFE